MNALMMHSASDTVSGGSKPGSAVPGGSTVSLRLVGLAVAAGHGRLGSGPSIRIMIIEHPSLR